VSGSEAVFPAPLRADGYLAWTWRLYARSFVPLFFVFVAGGIVVRLLHLAVIVFMTEVLQAAATVEALAISFAAAIVFTAIGGTLLAGVASYVFLQRLAGNPGKATVGWRRVRAKLGHVVVAALYVAMPLLTLFLFLGPIVPYILMPALLGPPVVVQAISWEQRDFRAAATRAKNLLAGSWGRVSSVLLLIAFGAGILAFLIDQGVSEAVVSLEPGQVVQSVWLAAIGVLTSAALWLLSAAASTVAYLDLRSRFEGFGAGELEAEAAERTQSSSQPGLTGP
jgi:hypothetical protein